MRRNLGTTLTRTGTSLTAQLVGQLGIPCWYGLGNHYQFPYCPRPVYKTRIILSHVVDRENFGPGCFRVIRDMGHGFLSYHTWFQRLFHAGFAPSFDEGVNCGLGVFGGGMFGLGYLEEGFLQNMLLADALGEEGIFRFETLKGNPEELLRLMRYLHYAMPKEAIEEAVARQQDEDAANGRPQSRQEFLSPLALRRLTILAYACGGQGYDYGQDSLLPPAPDSTDPMWIKAARKFAEYGVAVARNRMVEVNSSLFQAAIERMSSFHRELPLFELYLAAQLLNEPDYEEVALAHVYQCTVQNGRSFPALVAHAILAWHFRRFDGYLAAMRKNARAFNRTVCAGWWPDEAGAHTPHEDYFNSFFSLLNEAIRREGAIR